MSIFPEFPVTDVYIGYPSIGCEELEPGELIDDFKNENSNGMTDILKNVNCTGVENVYKVHQHNTILSGLMRKRIVKCDDSEAVGEYHTIDTKEWFEIDYHAIDNNRINVGRDYGNQEAIIFIQVETNGKTMKCKNFLMFPKKYWIEYRKERGENKYKKTRISENGLVWVGEPYIKCKLRVFVRTLED